ncbi:hypothetical protein [Dankookia sp. P2]|uniref:hypothetical protein n=1 Tax=Dankookia sp. P2 TaxID=3423955 RepID=UPI003D66E25C
MRKHLLGAAATDPNWTPRFSAKNPFVTAPVKRIGTRGMVVSWFPTWKGGRRMEPLRRYVHIDMAFLLEADPEVERWSATEGHPLMVPFAAVRDPRAPDFVARSGGRHFAIYVRAGDEDGVPDSGDLARRGYVNRVVRVAELATDACLPVARDILYFRTADVPDGTDLSAMNLLLGPRPPKTLGGLHQALDGGLAWGQVLSLVGRGLVRVKLAPVIDGGTAITGVNPEGWR